MVPANLNLVVNSLTDVNADNNVLTLREALEQCNNEVPTTTHTISFAGALQNGTITLNPDADAGYGRLSIKQNIEINFNGSPSNPIYIQRDKNSDIKHGIFYVKSGVTAKMKYLDIAHGAVNGGNGAGIVTFGNLTLDWCRVHHNTVSTGLGGAIMAQNGSLTLTECDIEYNSADIGGGVALNSGVSATFTNTVIADNKANLSGGGLAISCPATGAAANVVLQGCFVTGNEAENEGGGIWVESTAAGSGVNLTLKTTDIEHNKVLATQGKGGGIYFGLDDHLPASGQPTGSDLEQHGNERRRHVPRERNRDERDDARRNPGPRVLQRSGNGRSGRRDRLTLSAGRSALR